MRVRTFTTFLVFVMVLLNANGIHGNGIFSKNFLEFRQAGSVKGEDVEIIKAFNKCSFNWQPLIGEPCSLFKDFQMEAGKVILNQKQTLVQKLEALKKMLEMNCEDPAECATNRNCVCTRSTVDACTHPKDPNKDCGNEFSAFLPIAQRFLKISEGNSENTGGNSGNQSLSTGGISSTTTAKSSGSGFGPQFGSTIVILTTVVLVLAHNIIYFYH